MVRGTANPRIVLTKQGPGYSYFVPGRVRSFFHIRRTGQPVRQVGEAGAGARRKGKSGPPCIPIRKGLIFRQQRSECSVPVDQVLSYKPNRSAGAAGWRGRGRRKAQGEIRTAAYSIRKGLIFRQQRSECSVPVDQVLSYKPNRSAGAAGWRGRGRRKAQGEIRTAAYSIRKGLIFRQQRSECSVPVDQVLSYTEPVSRCGRLARQGQAQGARENQDRRVFQYARV